MTLPEALKTGLPLARKLFNPSNETPRFVSSEYLITTPGMLAKEDIIADDWFVQEKSITLTRTEFLEMFRDTLVEIGERENLKLTFMGSYGSHSRPSPCEIQGFKDLDLLMNKMGFRK